MSFIQAPVRVSILFLSMAVLWSGCTINRDIMFRTGDDFDFAPLEEMVSQGYRIAPNDVLQFRLFSNKGQRLNQMTAGGVGSGNVNSNQQLNNMLNQQGGVTYLVKPDGLKSTGTQPERMSAPAEQRQECLLQRAPTHPA